MLNTATPNNVITDVDFNLSAYIDQTTGFLYLKDSYGNIAPASDYLPSSGGGSSYLVYSALLNQSDTDAPVPTVLENTLGEEITTGYDGTGLFLISCAEPIFKEGKTFVMVSNTYISNELIAQIICTAYRIDDNNIRVKVTTTSSSARNGDLKDTAFEVRIYP